MHAIVLAAYVLAQPPIPTPPSACKAEQTTSIASGERLAPKPLDQMPAARLMRAVMLTVGSCAAIEEQVSDAVGAKSWRITPVGVADARYRVPVTPPQTPGP